MPSRIESRSVPGRRSLTSSRSSTPESVCTPPMRPSRARSCTLPRAEASNVAGVPLAANSAVMSIVPVPADGVLRERGAIAACDRQVAGARAALDVELALRRRQRERHIDPHSARGRDVGRELARVERNVGHQRLQAIAADVDMPGAQGNTPPRACQRPRDARSASAAGGGNRSSHCRASIASAVTVPSTRRPSPARAMLPSSDLKWLIRDSQRRVPHAHTLAVRQGRDAVDRERKIEHVGQAHAGGLELARRAGAQRFGQVHGRLEIAAQRAGGGRRLREDSRHRASRYETMKRKARALRLPVERRARIAVLVLERQAANLDAAGPVAEIEFGAGPARKPRRARDVKPPWRGRGPAHAGRSSLTGASRRAPRGTSASSAAHSRPRGPIVARAIETSSAGDGVAYPRSDPERVPRASRSATSTPSNSRSSFCKRIVPPSIVRVAGNRGDVARTMRGVSTASNCRRPGVARGPASRASFTPADPCSVAISPRTASNAGSVIAHG